MQWWEEYYRDVDGGQIEIFSKWYADDIVSRFGNMPVTRSKQALIATLAYFFQNFAGLGHVWNPIICNGDMAAGEGVCTYTLRDGRKISIPVATVIERREDGLIYRSSVYFDAAPLFAEDKDAAQVSDAYIFVRKQQGSAVHTGESPTWR